MPSLLLLPIGAASSHAARTPLNARTGSPGEASTLLGKMIAGGHEPPTRSTEGASMPGKGLEDVIAAQTSISDIDGKMGRLFYVGYDIHDLAPHATFEALIYLLHDLRLPTETELDNLNEQLIAEREISPFIENLMPTMASQTSPKSMLRTTV